MVNKLDKENFIKFISSMTKEDINDYIKEKGKPPKLIRPLVVLDNSGKVILK